MRLIAVLASPVKKAMRGSQWPLSRSDTQSCPLGIRGRSGASRYPHGGLPWGFGPPIPVFSPPLALFLFRVIFLKRRKKSLRRAVPTLFLARTKGFLPMRLSRTLAPLLGLAALAALSLGHSRPPAPRPPPSPTRARTRPSLSPRQACITSRRRARAGGPWATAPVAWARWSTASSPSARHGVQRRRGRRGRQRPERRYRGRGRGQFRLCDGRD